MMPIQRRRGVRSRTVLVLPAIGMTLFIASTLAWLRTARADDHEIAADDLQRSFRLDTYRVVADSGAGRGETLYFYKCWMCHNQYTKTAPLLKDLYQHKSLVGGARIDDETVTAKIKKGAPACRRLNPAFPMPTSRIWWLTFTRENAAWKAKIRPRTPSDRKSTRLNSSHSSI